MSACFPASSCRRRNRLHVVSEGAGRLPCCSAPASAARGSTGSRCRRLRERNRVIAFDRPGLGGSLPGRGRAGLREEAARLAGLARWAGPPVIVVAHSLAGFHAEAFARLYPD